MTQSHRIRDIAHNILCRGDRRWVRAGRAGSLFTSRVVFRPTSTVVFCEGPQSRGFRRAQFRFGAWSHHATLARDERFARGFVNDVLPDILLNAEVERLAPLGTLLRAILRPPRAEA